MRVHEVIYTGAFKNKDKTDRLIKELEEYFKLYKYGIIYGCIELQGGSCKYTEQYIFDNIREMLNIAIKGCNRVVITDKGNIEIVGFRDGGLNMFKVRFMNERGIQYVEKYSLVGRITQGEREKIVKYYSVMPRFTKNTYFTGAIIDR